MSLDFDESNPPPPDVEPENLDLFAEAPPADIAEALASEPPPLRDYQRAAVDAVRAELADKRGTLAVMATGTGKTQLASELIRTWDGRCLFIAHRDELITQAARRIEQFTGEVPDIEMGENRAQRRGFRHVVASIQSLSRERRLQCFDPGEFGLMVIDEAHHGVGRTYQKVIDYFASAKVLGITATPDRLDGEALGQIVDSVAFTYDIIQATNEGWLAPVVIKQVNVAGLDFSKVKTVAGDLNQGDLAKIVETEENLHAIAKPAVDLAGDRKTIVFAVSVQQAHRLAEIIDRYTSPGRAVAVDGSTDREVRREALRKFSQGGHQYLVNVGIATEGYDEPAIACVVMGRPTKSRALYSQMLGRGTRGGRNFPIPGKTDCLVLDFVGNSGKHDIVCAADILGGKYSDEELDAAKAQIAKAGEAISVEEAIKRADDAEKAKEANRQAIADAARARSRAHIKAEVRYVATIANPFVAFGVKRDYLAEKYGYDHATERQIEGLGKWMGKHAKDLPKQLSRHEASRMLEAFAKRRGLASYAQTKLLARFGVDAKQMPFAEARATIDKIAANGWRYVTPADREPGADG